MVSKKKMIEKIILTMKKRGKGEWVASIYDVIMAREDSEDGKAYRKRMLRKKNKMFPNLDIW